MYVCGECAALERPKPMRECAPCRALKFRAWYLKNPHKVSKWTRAYRETHREQYKRAEKVRSDRNYSKAMYGGLAETHRMLRNLERELKCQSREMKLS